MSMEEPKIAVPHSIKVQVKPGDILLWCTCGRSDTQPFCDNSHIGTGFSPIEYHATEERIVSFCGCKHSHNKPFCDGSHKTLEASNK
ncbi:MAG: CDGSH iron-sulfur domain-containing protein [Proteobacteria bacterium]|nr:CDGSH iron-sulfur domain-containing protein [Pseudomonadota bacterium]